MLPARFSIAKLTVSLRNELSCSAAHQYRQAQSLPGVCLLQSSIQNRSQTSYLPCQSNICQQAPTQVEEVLGHGPRNASPIHCGGGAPQLINDDQAPARDSTHIRGLNGYLVLHSRIALACQAHKPPALPSHEGLLGTRAVQVTRRMPHLWVPCLRM